MLGYAQRLAGEGGVGGGGGGVLQKCRGTEVNYKTEADRTEQGHKGLMFSVPSMEPADIGT